ncbi:MULTISPECIES: hypothetical protein [unclassified Thermoactinomyces]|uniref:hypothetical protein n=1 Tax=unclassified Thermoactinomyces TaxID=2634588 RepID=UPI0018DCA838|nr:MULTISPECIES: hypothetical protein [unclassified Thermoactinomyces]MBH8599689.1 hypothetical protein [Thermoactinomyces sp. CICC 10523]MBH8605807.1 hypothetical protein [Thermoactinomyces sp. CICC 10522]MBH8608707.1 hypothetical protein [Thermoactinomyces sp. CICC 10521]
MAKRKPLMMLNFEFKSPKSPEYLKIGDPIFVNGKPYQIKNMFLYAGQRNFRTDWGLIREKEIV